MKLIGGQPGCILHRLLYVLLTDAGIDGDAVQLPHMWMVALAKGRVRGKSAPENLRGLHPYLS
jgi:hypothetical protein